jgi:hypothetical protein
MIRIETQLHGVVSFDINMNTLSLLRLLSHHAPNLRIEAARNGKILRGHLIPLGQMNLTAASIKEHNPPEQVKT